MGGSMRMRPPRICPVTMSRGWLGLLYRGPLPPMACVKLAFCAACPASWMAWASSVDMDA